MTAERYHHARYRDGLSKVLRPLLLRDARVEGEMVELRQLPRKRHAERQRCASRLEESPERCETVEGEEIKTREAVPRDRGEKVPYGRPSVRRIIGPCGVRPE